MEQQSRFKIVFEELAQARREGTITEAEIAESARLLAESEETAELRRVVREITEPEPKLYTRT